MSQQDDIFELLDAAFPTVQIIAEDKGATAADVDIALAPRRVSGDGKTPGMVIVVTMPAEQPTETKAHNASITRTFGIRIVEAVEVNRVPRNAPLTGVNLATGHSWATARDTVVELLHSRGIAGGTLYYSGAEPFEDGKAGGVGYILFFSVTGTYQLPARAPGPLLDFAAGICTLNAGDADSIRYSVDGSAPLNGTLYTAPFAVTSGAPIRACAFKTGLQVSDFREEVAP